MSRVNLPTNSNSLQPQNIAGKIWEQRRASMQATTEENRKERILATSLPFGKAVFWDAPPTNPTPGTASRGKPAEFENKRRPRLREERAGGRGRG